MPLFSNKAIWDISQLCSNVVPARFTAQGNVNVFSRRNLEEDSCLSSYAAHLFAYFAKPLIMMERRNPDTSSTQEIDIEFQPAGLW